LSTSLSYIEDYLFQSAYLYVVTEHISCTNETHINIYTSLFLNLQILTAAYNVKLTTSSSSSFLHTFLERLRKLLHTFQLPWTASRRLDVAWKKRVATEMLDSLSAARLAKSISAQVCKTAPKCYIQIEDYHDFINLL
jgi:hypothetical protein